MMECRVFVPFGALGTGISQEAFDVGLAMGPQVISCDAGSTDSGPSYLGRAKAKYAADAIRRDMRLLLCAAHRLQIPITVGSAGTCGADASVDELAEICREIMREEGFHMKLARIYTEQDPEALRQKYREGRVAALPAAPAITEETFGQCSHIVALAGIEPFIAAFEAGAQVVLCGRATDTAVIAAYPIWKGCDRAAAWHGAKTAECGCLCTTVPNDGGVFLTFDESGFTVAATAPGAACTPTTVMAHLLYENADPICLTEPGCRIDAGASVYTQLENGAVRVTGTKYTPTPYTMKLEGAAPAGYQTVTLVGVRDREIMRNPKAWMENLQAYVQNKLDKLALDKTAYSYSLRAYGWNAVYGGPVPQGYMPNELGVLLTVTAETQELATRVAKVFNPLLLHFPVRQDRPLPSFAFPFSPAEIERGPIFEFKLDHVVRLNQPLELVRICLEE